MSDGREGMVELMHRRMKEYGPMLAGVSLIALGLCLPLGMTFDSLRLIDFFVMLISKVS
ncbi:hypothetical protein [Tumebacillus lipolyticus]|uniref:Uncharacterized protein n=1 Tax=Tumebacillus lipolyticus TaxID=1280370 RepID=A0ABW5A1V6_9BACL